MLRFRNKFSVSDAAFDLSSGFAPPQGFTLLIPVFKKVGDGPFQFGHGIKTTASDSLLADDAEPALDQVQPRRAGRGEVTNESWDAG